MQTKLILALVLLMSFLSVEASDWEIKDAGSEHTLNHSTYGVTVLESEAPTLPTILEVKDHSLFDIIVVDHGEVGTSCLVRIQKAYVFNKAENKFIGIYPYRIVAVSNKVKKCKVKPVIWETFKNFILIHDKNTDKKFKITP